LGRNGEVAQENGQEYQEPCESRDFFLSNVRHIILPHKETISWLNFPHSISFSITNMGINPTPSRTFPKIAGSADLIRRGDFAS